MYRPLLVNEELEILDGQHRLEAAKILNVPIFYEIQESADYEDIILLNSASKNWKQEDYINYFAAQDKEDYIELKAFTERNNVPGTNCVKALLQKGGSSWKTIRHGNFKFPSRARILELEDCIEKAKQVVELLNQKIIGQKGYINSAKFLACLVSFLSIKSVDFELFLHKINYRIDLIRPCANNRQFSNLFKNIYNWRNKNPIYIEEVGGLSNKDISDDRDDLF